VAQETLEKLATITAVEKNIFLATGLRGCQEHSCLFSFALDRISNSR
jgi:hypothetical protein